MPKKLQKPGGLFHYIAAAAAAVFGIMFVISFIQYIGTSVQATILYSYLLFAVICGALLILLLKPLLRAPAFVRVAVILIIGLIARMVVIYFIRIVPQGDCFTNNEYALYLSQGGQDPNLYFGTFAHAAHYPIFLSFLYRIFGNYYLVPKLVNTFFSLLEIACIMLLAERWISAKAGILTGFLAALHPSMILFVLFLTGEVIYGGFIMAALLLFVLAVQNTGKRRYLYWIGTGLLCATAEFFRPTGIVLMIAAILTLLFYVKEKGAKKGLAVALMLVSFAVLSYPLQWLTNHITSYANHSSAYGFNLYVGANFAEKGGWNDDDGQAYLQAAQELNDPSAIQKKFAVLGFKRYQEMGLKIIPHFINKLGIWFQESFLSDAIVGGETAASPLSSASNGGAYGILCGAYNFFILLGALVGLIISLVRRNTAPGIKTLSLYFCGVIALLLVLETASRYKGAFYGMLTLLATLGIFYLKGFLLHNTKKEAAPLPKEPIFSKASNEISGEVKQVEHK